MPRGHLSEVSGPASEDFAKLSKKSQSNFRIDAAKFSSIRKYISVYMKIYFRLNENLFSSIRKCGCVLTEIQLLFGKYTIRRILNY